MQSSNNTLAGNSFIQSLQITDVQLVYQPSQNVWHYPHINAYRSRGCTRKAEAPWS